MENLRISESQNLGKETLFILKFRNSEILRFCYA